MFIFFISIIADDVNNLKWNFKNNLCNALLFILRNFIFDLFTILKEIIDKYNNTFHIIIFPLIYINIIRSDSNKISCFHKS